MIFTSADDGLALAHIGQCQPKRLAVVAATACSSRGCSSTPTSAGVALSIALPGGVGRLPTVGVCSLRCSVPAAAASVSPSRTVRHARGTPRSQQQRRAQRHRPGGRVCPAAAASVSPSSTIRHAGGGTARSQRPRRRSAAARFLDDRSRYSTHHPVFNPLHDALDTNPIAPVRAARRSS